MKARIGAGASALDWDNLIAAGLIDDLLPVVSDSTIPVAENSRLKQTGKVPSLLTKHREAIGIPQWTKAISSPADIARWRNEPVYGICIQTRRLRGIDVDITGQALADEVWALLRDRLDPFECQQPHRRVREGSPKFLVPVFCEAEHRLAKRIIRCGEKGAIEILADGQQFIAAGTHTSGIRYAWDTPTGFAPMDFPRIAEADLVALIEELVQTFGDGDVTTVHSSGMTVVRAASPGASADPVVAFLFDAGVVKSVQGDGRVNITCPFESEHSTPDANDTVTQYFPAYTGRHDGGVFEQGHFRCLHAHCAHREDGDFLQAMGYGLDDFEDLPLTADHVARRETPNHLDSIPVLVQGKRGPVASTDNIVKALSSRRMCGYMLAYDEFRAMPVIADDWSADLPNWRGVTDEDTLNLELALLTKVGFATAPSDVVRRAARWVARENRIDVLRDWANSLVWDGVRRIDGFVEAAFGSQVEQGSESQSAGDAVNMGRYMWTAMAGRAIDPGIKADTAIVLVGRQGTGKSTAVEALAPFAGTFSEVWFTLNDVELRRSLQGRAVIEIAELGGMNTASVEKVKAFLSGTVDKVRGLYREFAEEVPRRCVFFGTTNEENFLSDVTGNRRFMAVRADTVDVDYIRRNHDQLWAEAVALYKKHGVMYRAVTELVVRRTESRMALPELYEPLLAWLRRVDEVTGERNGDTPFTLHDALNAIGIPVEKRSGRTSSLQAGKALRMLGYETAVVWSVEDQRNLRRWKKSEVKK